MKFFRSIRQKLAAQNKVAAYLRYAIGEIVLVVIGILIALQVNNWNEARKDTKFEIKYLKGIKANISDDIKELKRHFTGDTANFNTYTFLIRAFNSDGIEFKKQEIIANLKSSFKLHWFEGNDIVFEDMKSSGRLNLIQSDSIKYAIQKYYRSFQGVIKQEDLYTQSIKKRADIIGQYLNVSSFIEPKFPKQWNGNTGPPSHIFKQGTDFNQIKPYLIDNLSRVKNYEYFAHNARLELYKKAKALNKLIGEYLESKK